MSDPKGPSVEGKLCPILHDSDEVFITKYRAGVVGCELTDCIKAKKKEYYQKHEVKAKQKEYYQKPEVKAKKKEYYQKHADELKAKKKEYYQKHKKEVLKG